MQHILPDEAQALLQGLLERHRGNSAGKHTDYLPEFPTTDPGTFAVAVATVDATRRAPATTATG
jgi:glutaminase